MIHLQCKNNFDLSKLESGDFCLGYDKIKLLFNVGPFPGGGDCLIVEADGELITINSGDLIHDLDAYELSVDK